MVDHISLCVLFASPLSFPLSNLFLFIFAFYSRELSSWKRRRVMAKHPGEGEGEQQRLSMGAKRSTHAQSPSQPPDATAAPIEILDASKPLPGDSSDCRPGSSETIIVFPPPSIFKRVGSTQRPLRGDTKPHASGTAVSFDEKTTSREPISHQTKVNPPPSINVHRVPTGGQPVPAGPRQVNEVPPKMDDDAADTASTPEPDDEHLRSLTVDVMSPIISEEGEAKGTVTCPVDAICEQVDNLSSDGDKADIAFVLYSQYLKDYERKPSFTADTWDEIKYVGDSGRRFGVLYDEERGAVQLILFGKCYRIFILSFLLRFICLILFWAVMYMLASRSKFSPGGLYFDTLCTILFAGVVGSIISRVTRVPSVACAVLAAALYNNIPPTGSLTAGTSLDMRGVISLFGLTVGMIRGGLALNLRALKANFFRYLCFSVVPMVAEAFAHGFLAKILFRYPTTTWALLHGFIVTANAPGIIIPALIELQRKGYGTRGGPGVMILISVSVEATFCVWTIQLLLAIQFNTMGLLLAGLLGPIQIIVGLVVGVGLGYAFYFVVFDILYKEGQRVPLRESTILYATQRHLSHVRLTSCFIVMLVSMVCTSVGRMVSCIGGAAVIIVTMLALFSHWCDVASKMEHLTAKGDVLVFFRVLWDYVAMPALFAMAGASVNFSEVFSGDFFAPGIACVLAGLVVRCLSSMITPLLLRMPFTWRELVFCGIGSLGKGPMQAAFGAVPLMFLQTMGANSGNSTGTADDFSADDDIKHAQTLKNSAVLSMLVACPLCSILLGVLAQKLLRRDAPSVPAAAK
ncbi:hypothetical protein, conserved [Trypanosoma brucei brucei TREU927]|uniref:Cation/H+ exchanger transmembrane domain-containing protein n=1 Tax=Trypanosoma brucei brucei (strain 927/4 GUTat10.1) TaxID=185431 RepID=Q387G6_TRYB2|nr:hypothetical protein, conserved [Trypanosoma brucei brucei TREU927]EAN79065.1 hypothetical protein, conserved [Trypanosoma brucei brucei TREU927]